MSKLLIRARCLFGRWDFEPGCLNDNEVKEIYITAEKYLKEKGKPIKQLEINPMPHLSDGILDGPNVSSLYLINNNLVSNLFVSGNGFSFRGVYHTIISAGFEKEKIQETFDTLENLPHKYKSNWQDNPKLQKNIIIPNSLGKNLERILKAKPEVFKLLNPN